MQTRKTYNFHFSTFSSRYYGISRIKKSAFPARSHARSLHPTASAERLYSESRHLATRLPCFWAASALYGGMPKCARRHFSRFLWNSVEMSCPRTTRMLALLVVCMRLMAQPCRAPRDTLAQPVRHLRHHGVELSKVHRETRAGHSEQRSGAGQSIAVGGRVCSRRWLRAVRCSRAHLGRTLTASQATSSRHRSENGLSQRLAAARSDSRVLQNDRRVAQEHLASAQ